MSSSSPSRQDVETRRAAVRPEPYPGATKPDTWAQWLRRIGPRLKWFLVHNVLHLDDTPHRIALGVFLGFLIGATPTLGLQMILYFAAVAVLPANKVSGLGPIWITNPLTAVPIYYMNWRIGCLLTTGQLTASPSSRAAIARLVEGPAGVEQSFYDRLLSAEFWRAAGEALARIGGELWVGSLFVGVVSGLIGYGLTIRAVRAYRAHRRHR